MYGTYRLTVATKPDLKKAFEEQGRQVDATSDATTQELINKLFAYEEIGTVNEFRTLKEALKFLEDDRR